MEGGEASTGFYEWVKKRLQLEMLPHDIRGVVEEILERIEVESSTLRLGGEEVLVRDFEDVVYPLELLLYRSGYASRLGDKRGLVVYILSNLIREWVREQLKIKPSIEVEVKHVTEREVLADTIANEILSRYIIKTFYIPDPHKQVELGVYRYDGLRYVSFEEELKKEIMEIVRERDELRQRTTRWVVNEVISKVKNLTREPLRYERHVVAFKNTLFDWDVYVKTLSLRASAIPPSPDIIVFHRIPWSLPVEVLDRLEGLPKYSEQLADLEKVAKEFTPKTLKAFKEWVGGRWILLYEIIGAILYPKHIKKAFLLVDAEGKEGDTGKSTYIRLLQKLIGRENYSTVSLQELTDPNYRFRASRIYGKLANFYPDLPEKAVSNIGQFKALTGGDVITIERKHKEPFEWLPYTKHVFSCNIPPLVKGGDRAFWNRWIVIEFEGNFEKKIEYFEETLLGEAPYTLLLGIIAFGKVIARGFKFSFEGTPEDAKRKWLMRCDNVYAFIQSMIEDGVLVEDREGRIKNKELYEMYCEWCKEREENPVDIRAFPNRLRMLGFKIKRTRDGTYVVGLRRTDQTTL